MVSYQSWKDNFLTIVKRMPLKFRFVLAICVLIVIVEIVSGLIELSTYYKPQPVLTRRVVEIAKRRERKEITGDLINITTNNIVVGTDDATSVRKTNLLINNNDSLGSSSDNLINAVGERSVKADDEISSVGNVRDRRSLESNVVKKLMIKPKED